MAVKIQEEEFSRMRDELSQADEYREEAIQTSRDLIKTSKQVIFGLHRGEMEKATGKAEEMKALLDRLNGYHHYTGLQTTARQEYVEAVAYLVFVRENRLITPAECGVDTEEYLLGLCDLTGELMRRAVNEVIQGREENVQDIHDLVANLYGQFLQFNLRNSELRKKSDSIKWNLTKIEDVLYNLRVRRTD